MENKGFTLIELMIVIAIIGILAAIALPNFIAYRNKSFCVAVETDANNLAASIVEYFSIPPHNAITKGDQSYVPAVNDYAISPLNSTEAITITVTDASGRCPSAYTGQNPVNSYGDGWIDGTTYQKVIKN